MLKRFFFLLITFCTYVFTYAQDIENTSELERSDYVINVTLDTSEHMLNARQEVRFVNNTKIELEQVYFHLWANAYASNSSALISQQLMMGSSEMYFFNDYQRGGYHSLSVRNEQGLQLDISYQDESEEILIVKLPTTLKPGEVFNFQFEYDIRIPKLSSRFGYEHNYYQMAHWYPRLVKCDNGLWHAMPYLEIGEYYHDFADYEVNIQLPQGFQSTATGTVQELGSNQVRYEASNVTDFAWFASDQFHFERQQKVINGKEIDLEVVRHGSEENWDQAMDNMVRSLEFLSEEIGDYPFNEAKVILSKYGGNSGMEYPMITIIGEDQDRERLDHLIVHELAHNWFYGALSTNERRYPWLDEGLSTFYDHKYHQKYYGQDPYEGNVPGILQGESPYTILQASVHAQCGLGRLQPSNLHSEEYSALDYGISVYERPAMAFRFLESYLGDALFRRCIQAFYNRYAFSNPTPEDLQLTMEEVSDRKLDWFFQDFISTSAGPDYEIESVDQGKISMVNHSDVAAPFALQYQKDGGKSILWQEGFVGKQEVVVKNLLDNKVSLPAEVNILDSNPSNNYARRPMSLKFLSGLDNPSRKQMNYLPYIGYNSHDQLYAGISVYNSSFPMKRLRWMLSPAYAFVGEEPTIVGIAAIQYDMLVGGDKFRKAIAGLQAKRFNYFSTGDYALHYEKLKPFVRLYLRSDTKERTTKYLELNGHLINEEQAEFQEESVTFSKKFRFANQLKYEYWYQDPIASIRWSGELEYQRYNKFDESIASYLKLSSSYSYKYQFAKGRFLDFRIFGAYFLMNSERESSSFVNSITRGSIALSEQGFSDELYEDFFLGRNTQSGLLSRQINAQEGQFKTALTNAYKIGLSNNYAFAVNFKIDTPLLVSPFLDVGYYAAKLSTEAAFQNKTLYSIGLALELLDDSVGIYVPLINSSEINDVYKTQSFFSRISFKIDLNRLDLWKASEDYTF